MDNKKIFADNLNRQMEINEKSRQDVCQAIGVSYFTLRDWVTGKNYPRMDKVEMLAEYFGIKKSDLIEEKKENPADDGGMSENKKALIAFAQAVPEDKASMVLRVLKSIVEDD
jgi:repressor LexA